MMPCDLLGSVPIQSDNRARRSRRSTCICEVTYISKMCAAGLLREALVETYRAHPEIRQVGYPWRGLQGSAVDQINAIESVIIEVPDVAFRYIGPLLIGATCGYLLSWMCYRQTCANELLVMKFFLTSMVGCCSCRNSIGGLLTILSR